MFGYWQERRPALKNGVDMQLQSAFADENWPTVLRLADKRAKASGDTYYEAIKTCAETRLDSVVEKSAAAVTVDLWLRKGTVPKDVEVFSLLEWGLAGTGLLGTAGWEDTAAYAATLGALRLRWAKANPKDVKGLTACLQECLLHWDLENAQQIAAILDRSPGTNDRRFMYWNILLTHMLSADPQCPDTKQKIYGMLAQKQLEKASELTAAASDGITQDRSLRDEEEFILYYRVLASHASDDDFLRCVSDPATGALQQFKAGRKQPYLEVLHHLEATQRWDAVFSLCQSALQATDDAGVPSTLACDLSVWRTFVAASKNQADIEKAFNTVQNVLQTFVAATTKMPPMFTKTVGTALLDVVFELPPSLLATDSDQGPSARVEQLLTYITANVDKAAVFGDVKRYVEKLSFGDARVLLQLLDTLNSDTPDIKTHVAFLTSKLRYLLATCPQALWRIIDTHGKAVPMCKFCSQAAGPCGCNSCFESIALSSLQLYSRISKDTELTQRIKRFDKDPRVDLAMVAAACFLQLSGVSHSSPKSRQDKRSVHFDSGRRFLQAAAVLDLQLQQTPGDIPLRLLLVRMYLVLGCGSLAQQLWSPLGVKRSILDALGPHFFDRISTVAPGLFNGARPLIEDLRVYYATVLARPSAVKIWDAFTSGSYSSIIDMAAFHQKLRRSGTRAMAVVEERRATRAFGGRLEDVDNVDIFSDINPDVELVNVTDHGSMPDLNCTSAASLARILSVGPEISNVRMHLSLLAERYLGLINFKAPKEYKPLKAGEAAQRERLYLLESLAVVESNLMDLLHRPDTPTKLTAAEAVYFNALLLLSSLASSGISSCPGAPAPSYFADAMSALKTSFTSLSESVLNPMASASQMPDAALHAFTNLHGIAMLRDLAFASKQTAAFLAAFHDKETARDRSGKSGLHKDVLSATKTLKTASAQSLADVKAHIKVVKDVLGTPDFQGSLSKLVAGTDDGPGLSHALSEAVGGKEEIQNWTRKLVNSWRDTIKGWGTVQLE